MKRSIFAALLCALTVGLAGCGSPPPSKAPSPATLIPREAIRVPVESSRIPEGARGADESHYITGNPVTLTGSSIRIDAFGAKLIEGFENVYEAVYCPFFDPYGHVWTRAFGETDFAGDFPIVNGTRCISHAQAEANVRRLVEADYQAAVRALGMNLSQLQVDALDDFVWNLGGGIFVGGLRARIEGREWSALLAYDRAGGVVLSGLERRRETEVRLLEDNPPMPPKPKPPSHTQILHELRQAEQTRHALHDDIEAHKCRRGEHNLPREPERLRLKYHTICGAWTRQGGREIALESKLRKELR